MITVEGKKYKVTEDMGFNHSTGVYAKYIEVDGVETVVTRIAGSKEWEFWVPKIRPLKFIIGQ